MIEVKKISQDPTIYNYTLAKKTTFGPVFRTFHILLFILFESYEIVQYNGRTGLFVFTSVVSVYFLHWLIISLLLKQTKISSPGRWKMNLTYPLITFLPIGFVGFNTCKRVFTHMLSGGLFIIAIGYVWCPFGLVMQTLFLHLWILMPLFRVNHSFRKISKPGLIKWQQADCSYYYS